MATENEANDLKMNEATAGDAAGDAAGAHTCCHHAHDHAHAAGDAAHSHDDFRLLAALAGGCAVFGLLGFGLPLFTDAPHYVSIGCYIAAMCCGGYDALKDSLEDFPRVRIDVHFLMLVVAVGAALIGAWSEATLLLFLFSTSEAMEAFASHRTNSAINSLFKDQPKTATVIGDDGSQRTVEVEQLTAGDLLLVRPGDVFPADARVVHGETAADESSLTGESLPVAKHEGDVVLGGTANLWGAVRASVVRPAAESARQKIIRLIHEAQARKAPSQRFTDVFGRYFVPPVLVLTTSMFLYWWFGEGLPAFTDPPADTGAGGKSAFYRAMTLLVVSCPCALVLSIPSAILAAIARGARDGILFRGGAAIEKLAATDYAVFDKTGTLTTGELTVTAIETIPAGHETEALRLAAALEVNATHPLARAIVRCFEERRRAAGESTVPPAVENFKNVSGFGVSGEVGGVECSLGREGQWSGSEERSGTEERGENCPESGVGSRESFTQNHSPLAATEVFLSAPAAVPPLSARFLLADTVREESAPTLEALRELGVKTVMLTGDREEAAQAVGEKLGVGEILAGLTPAQKVARLRELADNGHRTAMLGDGVNDAPALAAAYVAVGMGARGADAALEQCDVVLMNDRIGRFLDARALSARARRIIRQNLAISLGTMCVMALGAIGYAIPLPAGVLAHEGSTVIVCLNSLRLLLGFKKKC